MVLEGGYGGVYAAPRLQRAARKDRIWLDLVSRENFFLFHPMLAEVVSGNIEPSHIVNAIRHLCRFTNVVQAKIEGLDVPKRQVIGTHPSHRDYPYITYDHLVIAVVASTDLSALPGVAEHAFPFKTLGDALDLRNHLITVLERAEVEENPEQKSELLTFCNNGRRLHTSGCSRRDPRLSQRGRTELP